MLLFCVCEKRQAFGASPAGISDSAMQQITTLEQEKLTRSPSHRKLDSQFVYQLKLNRHQFALSGNPNWKPDIKFEPDGRVLVDIDANVTDKLLQQIQQAGGTIVSSVKRFHSIRAKVPLTALEELAGSTNVNFIKRAVKSMHMTGSIDSEGDVTHGADTARGLYNVDGAGVKVGVLSDSVDYLADAQATGDLPTNVTVLDGQSGEPGTGEGTAMMEIVNDLAPGAQLYFATANNGEASFAQNILNLRSNGCDIILDDIFYYDESPFQDGIVAQAVNSVTADGALYFAAAGNGGNQDANTSGTWEGDFVNGGTVTSPEKGQIHSFGTATYDTVLGPNNTTYDVVLMWADPLGGANDDYDLFVMDPTGTKLIASSNDYQTGTQDPYEECDGIDVDDRIIIIKYSGSRRFLHLQLETDGYGSLSISTSGNTRGHSSATNAFAVAAVDATTAYPNLFITNNATEDFSSDGPRRVFFNADGSPITPGNFSSTGGIIRQKPDIAAADGVSNTVPGPFQPLFYGTSAATPHAAAIAALLLSYNENLTTAQIRAALTSTALDIDAPGADRDSGAGIVMAVPALQSVYSPLRPVIQPDAGFDVVGPVGGPFNVTSQSFSLSNSSAASLDWSAANVPSWLAVSPGGGTLALDEYTNVAFNLNFAASNLVAGFYTADIWFTNQTSRQVRRFTLSVIPPLQITPVTGFTATGPIGGPFNTTAQSFLLTNIGAASVNWSTINTSLWLTATPDSGTLASATRTNLIVSLNPAAGNLAAGTYAANLVVTDLTDRVAQSLQFTMNVGLPFNGGFETGDFTFWTLTGDGGYDDFVDDGSYYPIDGITPHSGNYCAMLGEVGYLAYLSQILPTVAGQSYLLSLWLDSSDGVLPSQFTVSWNGNTYYDQANLPVIGWTNLQFIVTATSSTSTLKFGAQDDNSYLGLDDISVTPISIPSLQTGTLTNGEFQFTWSAATGLVYQVEYKTNLLQPDWINAGNAIPAGKTNLSVTNSIGDDPQRFYRLEILP
ncbi:MAG: S8 family serine peptidase [Limisphaerales bacterium]